MMVFSKNKLMMDKYDNLALELFAVLGLASVALGNIFLALTILFAIYYIYKKGIKFDDKYSNYYKVLIVFLLSLLLSAICSGDIVRGLKVFANDWLWRLCIFFIITMTLNDYEKAKKLFLLSCIAMTADMLYIIYEGLEGHTRAAGINGDIMCSAAMLCMYLPLFFIGSLEGNFSSKTRLSSGVLFILSCVALLYNGTRGAWLAVLLTLVPIVFYYVSKNKKNIAYLMILVLGIGGYIVSNQDYVDRFKSISNSRGYSFSTRISLWESSMDMFKDYPVLGVGLGQYRYKLQEGYLSKDIPANKYFQAHSNIFQILAENGLVGFIGYIIFMGYLIFSNLKKVICARDVYALAIMSVALGLNLQGITNYNLLINEVVKYFGLLLGCLLVMQAKK